MEASLKASFLIAVDKALKVLFAYFPLATNLNSLKLPALNIGQEGSVRYSYNLFKLYKRKKLNALKGFFLALHNITHCLYSPFTFSSSV